LRAVLPDFEELLSLKTGRIEERQPVHREKSTKLFLKKKKLLPGISTTTYLI
jgi:hypothetical protein